MLKTETILLELSVIFAFIGLYYAFRAWILLKNTSGDVLRAKAFLTKPFLHSTIYLVFVVCIMVALHTIFEFVEYGYFPIPLLYFVSEIHILYTLTLTVSMALLAYLAHNLFRLLSSSR